MKISIRSLVKEFGSFDDPGGTVRAVDSVTLDVEDGELVTLWAPPDAARPPFCGCWPASRTPPRGTSSSGTSG
ncbi:hypothetical protein MASR2M17_18070 [Aminivibrio sp.]